MVLYYNLLLKVSTWRQTSEVIKELQRMSGKGYRVAVMVGWEVCSVLLERCFLPTVQKKLTL